MKLPIVQSFKFKNTRVDRHRPSFLLTGPPGAGKTLLAAELCLKLAQTTPDNVLVLSFPMDAEGSETLRDRDFVEVNVTNMAVLQELYDASLKMQPSAVIIDNVPAAWWMAYLDHHPDGLMPDDFGRSWNRLFADIAYKTVTRFKMHPWVKCFAATSLIWASEDAFTTNQVSVATPAKAKVERLQVTLPGQLKGNIYGMFSNALNLKMGPIVQGRQYRLIETQPSASVVAKVRAPLSEQPPATVTYDLADPKHGIDYIVKELKLIQEGS